MRKINQSHLKCECQMCHFLKESDPRHFVLCAVTMVFSEKYLASRDVQHGRLWMTAHRMLFLRVRVWASLDESHKTHAQCTKHKHVLQIKFDTQLHFFVLRTFAFVCAVHKSVFQVLATPCQCLALSVKRILFLYYHRINIFSTNFFLSKFLKRNFSHQIHHGWNFQFQSDWQKAFCHELINF